MIQVILVDFIFLIIKRKLEAALKRKKALEEKERQEKLAAIVSSNQNLNVVNTCINFFVL